MSNSFHQRWRLLLLVIVIVPFLLFVLWECGHYARFGDFFTYGYHTDLVEDHSDIGVPRIHAAYCLRLTNYTVHPLQFEAIQLPGGYVGGGILYHHRLEKWNEQTHSWSIVIDSAEAGTPPLRHANTIKSVLPGRSIYLTGCYEIATIESIHRGDTVRLVAFTSYSKPAGAPGQLVFYSVAFVINETSVEDQRK